MKSVLALSLCAVASADIHFSRTINTVTDATADVTISGCPATDQYGSNNCDLAWGKEYDVTYNVSLERPITTGAKLTVDLKASIIPLKFDCAACGANCTFKVPIVNKDINIALPPCPIKPAALMNKKSVTLPAKSPLPIKLDVKGSITLTNGDGTVIADLSVDIGLDKMDEEAEESDVIYLDWSKMFE
tara:strand:+ start:35 stop:598 length:564 start_codon:yes stop_codon:yes gene_type:complete